MMTILKKNNDNVYDELHKRGVNIYSANLKAIDDKLRGCYVDKYNAVVLDRSLSGNRELSTVAHEEYHAINRHDDTSEIFLAMKDKLESQAERYSCEILLDFDEILSQLPFYDGDLRLLWAEKELPWDLFKVIWQHFENGSSWAYDKFQIKY
jgi:Zn-dependent peptidase ImmA (M78 family)